MTIQALYNKALADNRSLWAPAVAELAQEIKKKADTAWGAVALNDVGGNEIDAVYQRGRAHAFCEVLGDQVALDRDGAFGQ
jgi:hypothetical protein